MLSLPIPRTILPFIPAIYVAWADGELTAAEIAAVRQGASQHVDADCLAALDLWLDPDSPPSADDLIALLMRIRIEARALPGAARLGLAELGLAIARVDATDREADVVARPVKKAVDAVEAALGLSGSEAVRELFLPPASAPPCTTKATSTGGVDIEALKTLFMGDQAEVRRKVRDILSRRAFRHEFPLPADEYRERVLGWLEVLAAENIGELPFLYGSDGAPKMSNVGGFLAAFETLAEFDLSLVVKFGVQFGLFGCSVLFLGTDEHHRKLLPRVASLALPGCFAMTELGHGSNVSALETVATYDPETSQFVIHTPTEAATKYYIGNAARHGRVATVFAQLVVGEDVHGVHAFVVPIRDDAGRPMAGVGIGDCGDKMGLDGVDNGWLTFDHVKVEREALLNRFGDVDASGRYSSSIASPTRRFFTMLSALVGGRIAIGSAALSASKVGLTIALRYGETRRQFGPAGEVEWSLMDYQRHRHRLLPRLATTVALDFAQKHLVARYEAKTDADARQVEALAAAIKSYQTWFATDTIQQCREACGAQGYMARNRIAALKADTDVFTTFEGDNTVLMQLVAKTLLTEFGRNLATGGFYGIVKHLTEVVVEDALERNFVMVRKTSEEHLRDPEFLARVFRFRKDDLLRSLGRRLKRRVDEGMDAFVAFAECQQHALDLSKAYAELVILEATQSAIKAARKSGDLDEATLDVLTLCHDVFALWRIHSDIAWFLENGTMEPAKARAIRRLVDQLLVQLRPLAPAVVSAFGIADHCLAPIALPASGG